MSDSKDTNELDSYGVWVKTPPKTVDSSDTTQNSSDTFSFDTDLPDFSDLDVVDSSSADSDYDNADTALSTEELFNITNDVENTDDFSSPAGTESPELPTASNGEEEISLDEFIEGGVFETGPDEDKIKEKEEQSQENAPAQQTETLDKPEDTVSFDDNFTVESDENENILPEEPVTTDTSELSDDDIFNIDLSFDDDSSANSAGENAVNFDSPAGTQDVDLSEFGFDEDSTENTEAAVTEPAVAESDDGMENIDLSEFGFEDTDSADSAAEEKTQQEDNFSAENETDVAEPDIEIPQEEENTAAPQEISEKEETAAVNQNADDDFDLDSILGNITDENGNTSSLADFEEPVQTVAEVQEEIKEPEVFDIPEDVVSEEIPQEEVTANAEKLEEPVLSDTLSEVIEEEPLVTEIEETQTEEPLETSDFVEAGTSDNEVQFEEENAETVDAKEVEIPDTFEEETSTFLEEDEEKANEFASSITAPVLSENELETEKPSAQMTAIFSQIVEELSSLKNEFASLKNEIETIKNQTKVPVPVQETKKEESHGFFADTDEDDTIALSTDELDNILQTADITQAEPQQAQEEALTEENKEQNVSEESEEKPLEAETQEVSSEELLGSAEEVTDFEEEDFEPEDDFSTTFETADEVSDITAAEIEEPVLDELDYSGLDSSSNLPEEISVPKADDILVESSSTDLLETSEVSEEAEKIEEPYSFEELTAEEPSIAETLTEEKLDYLNSTPEEDSLAEKTEDKAVEPVEEDSELEDFNFEEETQEENPVSAEPEEAEKTESDGISGDLKTEIKSVLSYMDQLLENLPEDKIAEFAQSQQFDTYKKLFKELGLA